MTALVAPSAHWRRQARRYIDRLARHCGLSDSALAEAIVAEAMQAAAESVTPELVRDWQRRMEDDVK